MLSACVATEPEFPAAFKAFDKPQHLDQLTGGEIRLIPYLFRRLERSTVHSDRFDVYKGIYTKFWYIHKMHRSSVLPLVQDTFDQQEHLLLKGAALQSLVYSGDPVTRPFDDVDIIVQPDKRWSALKALSARGFVPSQSWPTNLTMNLKLAIDLRLEGANLDLHWGLYPSAGFRKVTDDVFSRAVSVTVDGLEAKTLSITDHLLHNLVHGFARNEVSPIRWVVDSALLVRTDTIDWDLFVSAAHMWGWQGVVSKQLKVLSRQFEVDMPIDVIPRLGGGRGRVFTAFYQFNRSLKPSFFRGFVSLCVVNPMNHREVSRNKARSFVFFQLRALGIWMLTWRNSDHRRRRLLQLIRSVRR